MLCAEILLETVDTNSPAFRAWFAGSKVVDYWRQPEVVYHGALHFVAIERFKPLTHFGTTKAANTRLKDQQNRPGRTEYEPAIYPVYLSIKQPLRITDRASVSHSAKNIAYYLAYGTYNRATSSRFDAGARNRRYGKISLDEFDRIEQQGNDAFIEIMKAHGYDGLVYQNRIEHRGSDSWVIFDAAQVWPLYANHPG